MCVFLTFEVHYISAYQTSEELAELFNKAKKAFIMADYMTAKGILELLKVWLSKEKEKELLKGKTYLLLGATYEKLRYYNFAIKYYCMAKNTLGEGESIQGLDLAALISYRTPCETKSGLSVSYLITQFEKGFRAYTSGNYERAKITLEGQLTILKNLKNFDSLKGETYFLLGATCEMLNDKVCALKYYSKARDILGEVDSIEGIPFGNLRWARGESPKWAATEGEKKKRKGISGPLGLFLSIGLFAGLVTYLLLKKDDSYTGPTSPKQTGSIAPILTDLEGPTEVEVSSTCIYRARGYDPDGNRVAFLISWEYDTTDGKKKTFSWESKFVSNNEWVSCDVTWSDARSGGNGLVRAKIRERNHYFNYEDKDLYITFK
jgi:tetratricopeptide (TPR) repeat protein